MNSVLNHVAILVENIELVLKNNFFSSSQLGKIEEFPSEGTRELYVGSSNQMGRLLLMQSIGDGPYKKALEKRGHGLHHMALDVLSIDQFVASLVGSGWLLHPKSIEYYSNHKQVYLCRPGVPVLLEIQQKEKLTEGKYIIEELRFPFQNERLLSALGCNRLKLNNEIELKIGGKLLSIKDFLR